MDASSAAGQTMKTCITPECDRPAYCKGFCTACYQRHRYKHAPGVAERVRAANKAYAMANTEKVEVAAREYARTHRGKVKRNNRRYRARVVDAIGVSPTARYRPGDPCQVVAGGQLVWGEVATPAFRSGQRQWSAAILLPWGEVVDFPTNDVAIPLRKLRTKAQPK